MNATSPRVLWVAVAMAMAGAFTALPPLAAAPSLTLLDTDIGNDIDDALAVALVLRCPEIRLLGVTTVGHHPAARARLAAQLLAAGGAAAARIPVRAGEAGPPMSAADARWGANLEQTRWSPAPAGKAPPEGDAIAFLRTEILAHPHAVTLLALGPLTNVAAVLRSDSRVAGNLHRIVLMGGALRRGYAAGSPPQPEWNIRLDVPAARTVLAAGVPLTVVPLDASEDVKLEADDRAWLFSRPGLGRALGDLYRLWGGATPSLCDPVTAEALARPSLVTTAPLHLAVDADGLTRTVPGASPNAAVVLELNPGACRRFFLERIGGAPAPAPR